MNKIPLKRFFEEVFDPSEHGQCDYCSKKFKLKIEDKFFAPPEQSYYQDSAGSRYCTKKCAETDHCLENYEWKETING